MAYRLSVDLGASTTAAAVSVDQAPPTPLPLGRHALQIPSVLFVGDDGLLAGEMAEDRGMADPDRLVTDAKRRLGEDVPVTIGDTTVTPVALTAALLRHVAARAGGSQGGAPTELVLTHPATWGSYKLEKLDQAVHQAGVGTARRCTEAEAAAAAYVARHQLDPGMKIAIYDLGGGTFDVTVLERTRSGFAILGTPGEAAGLGGTTFDEAIYRLVLGGIGDRMNDLDQDAPDTKARLAEIRRGCVRAKETLSSETQAVVPVDLPGFTTTVRVTRSEFGSLIRSSLRETTAALRRVLHAANTEPGDLTAIALVGGSSRIPAVAEVLQREFGVPLALGAHPKHDVAVGALLALAPVAAAPVPGPGAPAGEVTTEIRTPPSAPPSASPSPPAAVPTPAGVRPAVAIAAGAAVTAPASAAGSAPAPAAAAAAPPLSAPRPATPPAAARGTDRPVNHQEPRMAFPPPPPPPGPPGGGPPNQPPRSWSPNPPSGPNPNGPHPQSAQGQPYPGQPNRPPAGPGQPGAGPRPGPAGPPPGYPAGYPAAGGAGGMGGRPPGGGAPVPGFPSGHAPVPPGAGGAGAGGSGDGSRRTLILILAGALLLAGLVATGVVLYQRWRGPDIATVPTVRPTTFSPRPSPTPTPTPTLSPTPTGSASPSPTPSPSTSLSQVLPKSASIPVNLIVAPIERDGDRDLFLVDVTGKAKTKQLPTPNGPDNNPMMQPSRDTIIYINESELRVMAADGTGDRVLLDAPPKGCGAIEHASWSRLEPDQLLVQCVPEKEVNELMVIQLNGTVVRRLKIGQERIEDPSLSADGQTVLFWASDNFDEQGGSIYSMPIDNSEKPTRLTKSGVGEDADPAFSPDGELIAFRRRVSNGTADGNLDIFVMRSTGKKQRSVVSTPADDVKPIWSPDGQQLLVVSNRSSADGPAGDTYDLWLTRASNGKVVRKLGLKAPYVTTPFWVQK